MEVKSEKELGAPVERTRSWSTEARFGLVGLTLLGAAAVGAAVVNSVLTAPDPEVLRELGDFVMMPVWAAGAAVALVLTGVGLGVMRDGASWTLARRGR